MTCEQPSNAFSYLEKKEKTLIKNNALISCSPFTDIIHRSSQSPFDVFFLINPKEGMNEVDFILK